MAADLRPRPHRRHGRQPGRRGRPRHRRPRRRIAAIGDLSRASAGERRRLPGPAHPARRDRHPGAFPRARASTTRRISRRGSRAAVLGGVTAVFEMPNTNPLTTTRRGARRQDRRAPRDRMHCDFAFWVGGTHENVATSASWSACRARPASRSSWAPRPARCWSRTMRASRAILRRTRRRAAFHSEDEAELRERKGLRVAGRPVLHPVWRDAGGGAALRPSGSCASRRRPARASTCCTSRPPRRCASSPTTRTSRPSRRRRII